MFPPMCVEEGVSTAVKLDDITDKNEKEILLGKVIYKLRFIELIKKYCNEWNCILCSNTIDKADLDTNKLLKKYISEQNDTQID